MKEKKKIGRREFLKVAGTGAAVTTAALYGCKPRSAGSASEADGAQQGQMTYRTNPKTGDRVSLLGYGCMRWPTVSSGSARDSGDRDRPGDGQRAGRPCHCPRGELFRHFARLLPGAFRTCHGRGAEPPSPRQVFHSHQTVQFRALDLEPRSLDGHVPQFVPRAAGRLYRLPAAARRGHGQRHGGVRSPLHRQRDAGFPACRA